MDLPGLISTGQPDATEAEFTKTFGGIRRLIESYQKAGAKLYPNNPESLSAARLSMLELWVTMDVSAVQLVPLLREYDTGFLPGLFDGLVLPKLHQLHRLARVEDYLERRRAGAGSNGVPWRYHDGDGSWSNTCFAACYFNSSSHHQRLYRQLKNVADAGRLAASPPSDSSRPGFYLWPLFCDRTEAKVLIFEADAPSMFTMWRETTRSILTFFCDESADITLPGDWRDRRNDFRSAVDELLSKVGPLLHTTGALSRSQFDPLFTQVEGPLLTIWNDLRRVPSANPGAGDLLNRLSYVSGAGVAVPEVLRRWVCSTAHTPNEVLAARPQCPPTMAPDEFRAFGDLRAGQRLQWHNILLQLAMPSLNITRPDVFCLVMQAAHEAGPRGGAHLGSALRSTHNLLAEVRFGNTLLGGLEDALSRVADQQNSEVALCLLVSLSVRLLSLSPDRQVQERCLAYLCRLRHAGRERARVTAAELELCDAADEERRTNLAMRTQLAALACHATFDVGARHHASVLSDNGEAALLLESAIRAAAHAAPPQLPEDHHASTPVLDVLLYRWRRLSHEMESLLRDRIRVGKGRCLNMAIQQFWPSCRPDDAWSPAPAPHAHVLVTRQSLPGSPETLPLEYNLLTGSLMIGGAPLGGLPPHIREHPTYRLLFGDRAFTVVQSYTKSQGVQYFVTSSYHGHRLQLALLEGDWLMVRSEKDGTRYEFIPPETMHRCLEHSLPRRLIDGYTHWMVLGKDRIEFRPQDNVWQTLKDPGPSCGGYELMLDGDGHRARLTSIKVGSAVARVCSTSKTAQAVDGILGRLESLEQIDLSFDRRRRVLSIDLPRLRLSFHLAQGKSAVVSSQYAGYTIDEDQSIGTLAGLKNKLVLCRSPCGATVSSPLTCSDRLLLVPAGEVSFEAASWRGRARVTRIVTTATAGHRVRCHAFRVDTMLGCLRDRDGAVGSLLLLCHLHAITTHCLPDRLTGRTGAEEALRILELVALHPPNRLLRGDEGGGGDDNDDHLDRLRRIGSISPLLDRDGSSVQQIRWSSSAPAPAQYGVFGRRVRAILGQAGVTTELPALGDASLVRRAEARASAYYILQYSDHGDRATKHPMGYADVQYPGWPTYRTERGYSGEVEACRLARHLVHGGDAAALLYQPHVPSEWGRSRQNRGPSFFFDSLIGKSLQASCLSLDSCISKLPLKAADDTTPPAQPHLLPPAPTPKPLTSIDDMFARPAPEPPAFNVMPTKQIAIFQEPAARGALPQALQRFLDDLSQIARPEHEYEGLYVEELRQAAKALETIVPPAATPTTRRASTGATASPEWRKYVETCRVEADVRFAAIRGALHGADMPGEAGRLEAASRPAVTPVMLLEHLSRQHRTRLSGGWLQCLVNYAVALTALQRAERLAVAAETGNHTSLAAELRNEGHENWDPVKFPDWVLLEVDMDILIRPIQARVATAMMEPPGQGNHVMQLHMGEGKSAVIVPMVAAALADGSRLVRVVVAKPQSKQMLHTLTRALGGLLARSVYPLPPFARGAGHDGKLLALVGEECEHALRTGGVVVAQPEHLLSFRLGGVEAALVAGGGDYGNSPMTPADAAAAAGRLLAMQRFWDRNTRDIVDESDEVFHPRSELVYTMGPPTPIDLGDQRWRLIQNVLGLVAEMAPALREAYPGALEVGPGVHEGRFPQVRILSDTGASALADRLVERIFDGGLPGFPHMAEPNRRHGRDAALRYVRQPEPTAADIATVEAMFAVGEVPEGPLLLLRGLVACDVLSFCLRKRWGVDYGRTDTRDPPTGLAVPFRGKDLPSPRSEFGHPDVVIVLTCLSYYYGGLRSKELHTSLERLATSAGGERRYTSWVLGALHSIPRSLHQLGAIDIQDHHQFDHRVFPHLCRLRLAVDYYLAELLFEREIREFSQTLSTSAWSLAMVKPHPTTGFSGTHDAKCLLPLEIEFLDLPEQKHAKAQVLGYLLGSENAVQDLALTLVTGVSSVATAAAAAATARSHDPLTTPAVLRLVVDAKPLIRVIIDAGAQIIGLDNAEVARRWLALVPETAASAAVYFDGDETMCVVTRDGVTEPFLTSPYVANTASCIIFLDQAHTRGTDIRLPDRCRAAVTLGPMLSKDRLIQACMRMRQLGRGHSVVFFVPAEIRERITALRGIQPGGKIRVADVLSWSIEETWNEARRLVPLWAAQGHQHQRQLLLGDAHNLSSEEAARFLESDGLTLRERYGPVCDEQVPSTDPTDAAIRIRERCRAFGARGFGAAALQQEQEREREREILVERATPPPEPQPLPVQSLEPSLHTDVQEFVRTGIIPSDSAAFMPALRALAGSSITGLLQGVRGPPGLLATAEFARTVQLPTSTPSSGWDLYQRPVQWIVTAPTQSSGTVAVVLSPWEADALLPIFRAGGVTATLHLFAPRTSLTTRSAEDLLLYTTPAPRSGWCPPRVLLRTLLLFAGQLYLRSYDDYVAMCRFLGVPYSATTGDDNDNSLAGANKGGEEAFVLEPAAIQFFEALFERIRHPATDISTTDMGHIFAGDVRLQPSAFSGPLRAR
ncbi:hypothetical protein QBC39DRAFT_406982 [Podospora conica]|nr:hypothetical protein QBC39DRAFT_406982 [Schizothecium conicum]